MARARLWCADAAHIGIVPSLDIHCDGGHVETAKDSEHVKTGQGKRRSRREAPLVGLALGLLGGPWAQRWLEATLWNRRVVDL
eukprot:417240-Pyramimonas_sp.AAC.1